jgi:hypothetical protein
VESPLLLDLLENHAAASKACSWQAQRQVPAILARLGLQMFSMKHVATPTHWGQRPSESKAHAFYNHNQFITQHMVVFKSAQINSAES